MCSSFPSALIVIGAVLLGAPDLASAAVEFTAGGGAAGARITAFCSNPPGSDSDEGGQNANGLVATASASASLTHPCPQGGGDQGGSSSSSVTGSGVVGVGGATITSSGSAQVSAFGNQNAQEFIGTSNWGVGFIVTGGPVEFEASGSLSNPGEPFGVAQVQLPGFSTRANGGFEQSGTLQPGFYSLDGVASCGASGPNVGQVDCTASYSRDDETDRREQ